MSLDRFFRHGVDAVGIDRAGIDGRTTPDIVVRRVAAPIPRGVKGPFQVSALAPSSRPPPLSGDRDITRCRYCLK